jgi:hypothetical protein
MLARKINGLWFSAIALTLLVSGCASGTSHHSTSTPRAKVISIATAAIHNIPKASISGMTSAKLIPNPYVSDTKLNWPKEIWAVTYRGNFPVPTPCPSGTKSCKPGSFAFTSATVIINPVTGAVLETVEPAWKS